VAGPAPADGWAIHVTDDHAAGAEASGETIAIRSGGLATSGTNVRRWRARGGAEHHHIVDPRSGGPAAAAWRTATVAAARRGHARRRERRQHGGDRARRRRARVAAAPPPARAARRARRARAAPRRVARGGGRMSALPLAGVSATWILTRGSGAVSLLLLSATL